MISGNLLQLFQYELVIGGEGGIRTPDTRKGMPDFESGAFNRALPPLRFVYNTLRDALEVLRLPLAVLMALAPPEIRSTAACLWFTLKCAYRLVICAVRCPRSSPTVCESSPAITSLLANVWRLQCQV